jgi:hypothetical protein
MAMAYGRGESRDRNRGGPVPVGLNHGQGKFPHREGEQFDDPDPAGKTTGISAPSQEVLGPGEDELPRPLMPVQNALEIRKDLWDRCNLIKDCPALLVLRKKTAWVSSAKARGVGIFQYYIGQIREDRSGRGCLS